MTPSTASVSTPETKTSPSRPSLNIKRFFTKEGVHPFDTVTWVKRDAVVGSGDKKVFEQKEVEFPDFWSANAINITASKYFRGKLGAPEREWSLKQMITRVTATIRDWGEKYGYFASTEEAQIFADELSHLILFQKGSFNSPVWFNVGSEVNPQCSACFILSVEDTMSSILDWIKTEGYIFKGGSGAGINLSTLRSKNEHLSKGGKSSGPVSFMRGADSVAGMIKSGGTTRRAAKMVVLNIDHPDILDFIRCKAEEEKKVRALIEAGYNMADLNDDAWNSIQFQNANNSVRVTDDFMAAVESDREWQTKQIKSGAIADTYQARELLEEMAEAAWSSGDPGIQFDTTINDWHTCPNSGRINASNPCSEYMHLDDSACNLASINLMKFLNDDGTFNIKDFKQTVGTFILAQDIIVEGSSYPTPKITKNAKAFRELGLGYANLGALIMSKGLAYDSDEGRALAGAITSVMTGEAYRTSALLASRVGPFSGYVENQKPMLRVIKKHQTKSREIDFSLLKDKNLINEATAVWDEALKAGETHGYRNSQATVLAPTGTISFMMDCDTTSGEPDFSLVKMKQLVGGGWMKIINQSLSRALKNLNYSDSESKDILNYVLEHHHIEGAPHLKVEHLSIFDCAVTPSGGSRSIAWPGHVKMVGAIQPFISGAISKTFNMPATATREDIMESFLMSWHLGVKALAVYRDGSKSTQPLNTKETKKSKSESKNVSTPFRRRLPTTRPSETHKFSIAGHEGYITYSMYEDGAPAEIFIRMAKQGSTLSGLLDAFAVTVSISLQYGVPLKNLCDKFIHSRFEPAGFTENPDIRIATSIIDYIFQYLSLRFLTPAQLSSGDDSLVDSSVDSSLIDDSTHSKATYISAGTVCRKCGGMMVRTGTCQTCLQCGNSSGGCS